MIGTLVVSLPSAHAGGELVIEHNDETVVYRASATDVTVAAFYADCRHEVKAGQDRIPGHLYVQSDAGFLCGWRGSGRAVG